MGNYLGAHYLKFHNKQISLNNGYPYITSKIYNFKVKDQIKPVYKDKFPYITSTFLKSKL